MEGGLEGGGRGEEGKEKTKHDDEELMLTRTPYKYMSTSRPLKKENSAFCGYNDT